MPYMLSFKYPHMEEWQNTDHIFETGQEAGARCKELNSRSRQWGDTVKYRVLPLLDDDPLAWRIRQEAAFRDGTYTVTPWNDEYGHSEYYEHVSPDDPTKVRFIASETDGQRKRFTVMAPGRFFLRYVNGYPRKDQVEGYCAKMGLDMTVSALHIAMEADEIERVYTNGPHSCMTYEYDEDKFQGGHHPVRQYAAGDLGVAYIERSGEITARCMVWPEKKWHGRVYGDASRLRERLAEAGYEENWSFVGAKLLLERYCGQIIAPYVDGDIDGKVDVNLNRLILVPTEEATVLLKSPDGVAEAESCQNCGAQNVPIMFDEDADMVVCREGC